MGLRSFSPSLMFGSKHFIRQIAFDPEYLNIVHRIPDILGNSGATCDALFIGLPSLPEFMLFEQNQVVNLMESAVELAISHQVQMIGLGALCAVVGLRGQALADRIGLPVTTGNSLTTWSAFQTLKKLKETLKISAEDIQLYIVGIPGTVANGVLGLLMDDGWPNITLVASPITGAQRRVVRTFNREFNRTLPVSESIKKIPGKITLVLAASSTGNKLVDHKLPEGTLVIDVAEPRDLARDRSGPFKKILMIDGETVTYPNATLRGRSLWTHGYNAFAGQWHRHVFACLAEPMVLALEGRLESFSLGNRLNRDKIKEIGALADFHGFQVREFTRYGLPMPEWLIRLFVKKFYGKNLSKTGT